MTHPVSFVSLGPGDPELITLKGLKVLQRTDIIYCPGTKNTEGQLISRSADIVNSLGIDTSVSIFPLPMSKDRSQAFQVYDDLYENVFDDYQSGREVAIVAEGDSGFYSSIQYLYDKLISAEIAVQRIAGVPAFIAAGALANLHIVKQEEQLHIIPGITTKEELAALIEKKYTIVIMKLSQCKDELIKFLQINSRIQCHYFENIGNENQFYSKDLEVIKERKFPYFSLLIIKP